LAGALLFDEKIRQSAPLFWFGLRDVGILYSRAVIQRTNYVCRIFGDRLSKRLDSFSHEAAQNFELLSIIQDQK
jgi:hypothetical protein